MHEKKLIELRVLTNVTADDIFEAFLKFGNRIKVFHYAGHAKDFDLLLKESKTSFSIKGFGPFLASHKNLKLVFMNACSTSIQESVLFEAGIPELILTNKPINDETAVDFANLFYKGLASGKTVAESFSSAKH
ncbi:MAG: CHAT domain-containing protein, partial [Bacteroidia bacterium]